MGHESGSVGVGSWFASIHPFDDVGAQIVTFRIAKGVRAAVKRHPDNQLSNNLIQFKKFLYEFEFSIIFEWVPCLLDNRILPKAKGHRSIRPWIE